MEITFKTVANITYSGSTFNTPVIVTYKHTGIEYFKKTKKGKKYFSESIAKELIESGEKVLKSNGYYFIKRLAIPTIKANGDQDVWYINNEGDNYSINKVSKYWKKRHAELSSN